MKMLISKWRFVSEKMASEYVKAGQKIDLSNWIHAAVRAGHIIGGIETPRGRVNILCFKLELFIPF